MFQTNIFKKSGVCSFTTHSVLSVQNELGAPKKYPLLKKWCRYQVEITNAAIAKGDIFLEGIR